MAATESPLGVAAGQLYNRPDDTAPETSSTQRVRIPMTLKTWTDVDTRSPDGKTTKSHIAAKPITQVLRARIERSNDFYIGDWRIQTTPVRWLKRSNQYQVRLEAFRRYGEAGQLEESLGSITLTGLLEKQDDGLYILNGTARRVFRDKSGTPVLDLDAGQHQPYEKATAISRR
jgi:hypothetical protein